MKLIYKIFFLPITMMIIFGTYSAAEELVGNFSGELNIHQGQANYNIPIQVPEGINNLQPSLSFVYNSGAGNGLLSQGWNLSGLSTITRCPQTLHQDGQKRSIHYDRQDRYCLDGQRLILIKGSYGAANSEYRTEIDSYSKIVAYEQKGYGPSYWRVWTKEGLIKTYGQTSEAKLFPQGQNSIHSWYLNQISDVNQNNIDYHYYNQGQRIYLQKITYAKFYLEFVYFQNNNPQTYFYQGRKVLKIYDKYLSQIKLYNESQLTQTYNLSYSTLYNPKYHQVINSKEVFLNQIKLCDQDDQCLPPIKLEYQTSMAENLLAVNDWGYGGRRWMIDFNGDGKSDFCRAVGTYKGNGSYLQCGLSTETSIKDVYIPLSDWGYKDRRWMVDFNGDGKTDYCRAVGNSSGSKSYLQCELSTGTSAETILTPIYDWGHSDRRWWVDFNGDGKTDYCRQVTFSPGKSYLKCDLSTGRSTDSILMSISDWGHTDRRWMIDFNGDGKTDYCRAVTVSYGAKKYLKCDLSTGRSTQTILTPISDWGYSDRRWWVDFNGDGKMDYCRAVNNSYGSGLQCDLSTGTSTEVVFIPIYDWGYGDRRWWVDFNGDGKTDFCRAVGNYSGSGSYLRCDLSNGSSIKDIYIPIANWGDKDLRWWIDSNGDGKKEFCRDKSGNLTNLSIPSNEYLLQKIYTKNHLTASLTYNQHNYYTVQQVKKDNGLAGFNTTQYNYGDFIMDPQRGALGFNWVKENQVDRNLINYTKFYQRFPLMGVPQYLEKKLNNQILQQIDFSYTQQTHPQSHKIYQIFLQQKVEKIYQLTGGLIQQANTKNAQFDQYGNISHSEATVIGDNEELKTITENTYTNDSDNWILGRLTATKVTYQKQDQSQVRYSTFQYNQKTGQLTQKNLEPASSLTLTTNYTYDQWGNKLQTSSHGSDQTRVNKLVYDKQGLLLKSQINSLGHTQTYQYDEQDRLAQLTDPNGLVTKWEYDSLGRTVKETRADGTTTIWEYAWDNSLPPAYYRMTQTTSAQAPITVIYDRFNRELRTISIGFEGQTIYQDREYNHLGQLTRQSLPYFTNETPLWITFTYDELGRLINKQKPLENNDVAVTRIEYDGLTTRYINANGQIRTIIKNTLGQTIKVIDAAGGVLLYYYDVMGNMIKSTDVAGNVTNITYNQLGHKTSLQDPNLGYWQYRYNAFGQLVWQKDPKEQIIENQYDLLGRLIQKTTPETVNSWIYDQSPHGIGKLSQLQSDNFTKRYTYDNLGRLSTTITQADQQTYSITTAYDEFGRIDFQTHPYNFRLYREYNQYGYLTALKSPKTADVDGFDQQDLKQSLEQALLAATTAQRLAWENRITKLRYDQKAITYRKIAAFLGKNNGGIVENLRQASETLEQYSAQLATEAQTNESQAQNFYLQAQQITQELQQSPAYSDQQLYQDYVYHQQMRDMLTQIADLALNQNDTNFLTQSQYELAEHCLNQVEFHQKKAQTYQDKVGNENLNGLDQVQMMVDNGENWNTYWRAGSYDAKGRITSEINGNGLYTAKTYNPAGEITQILSRFGYQDPIRNLNYTYDQNHNVTMRYDQIQNVNEEFEYDSLDRLTKVQNRGIQTQKELSQFEILDPISGDPQQKFFIGQWRSSGGRSTTSTANPHYTFTLKARSLVILDLRSYWNDTYLYLTDAAGKIIATNDDGGEWLFSRIKKVLDPGKYKVIAATYASRRKGFFMLKFTSGGSPSILKGKWQSSGGRQAHHANNPIIPINITQEQTVQIDLISSQDTYLYLLNAERQILDQNDDGGISFNSQLKVTLKPGQYYLTPTTYHAGRAGDFEVILTGPAQFGSPSIASTSEEATIQQTFQYDAQGNITYNSHLGDYQYDQQHPQRVTQVGEHHYQYDPNGNLVQKDNLAITWNALNKPISFTSATGKTTFQYSPSQERYAKATYDAQGQITTTFYLGKSYEQITQPNGDKQHKYFIYVNNQLIAIHIKEQPASITDEELSSGTTTGITQQIRYFHYDNLGSIDTITDGQGQIVERMSYTPFGQKRSGNWVSFDDQTHAPSFTNRGFTGHEHLDELDLIHMNGRVYDPVIGRFMSADPFIQAPKNSQSFNRYSYTMNNPLKYTDPSGYSWFSDALNDAANSVKDAYSNADQTWHAAVHNIDQTWKSNWNNAVNDWNNSNDLQKLINPYATIMRSHKLLNDFLESPNMREANASWHNSRRRGQFFREVAAISAGAAAGWGCGGSLTCAYAAYEAVKGYDEAKENGANDIDALRYASRRAAIGAVKGYIVQLFFEKYGTKLFGDAANEIGIVAFSASQSYGYFKLVETIIKTPFDLNLDHLAGDMPDENGDDDPGMFDERKIGL